MDSLQSSAYEYDNNDNKTRESYYNQDGDLIWCNEGYCEILLSYNERNYCIEERLLTRGGRPALHKAGLYSSMTREVDENGRVTAVHFYDEQGKPTYYANDYAEAHYTYDLAGRQIEVSYFDKEGKPMAVRRGFAKKTTTYNTLGLMTEEAYYDVDNNLVDITAGYAKAVYTYDDLGNKITERYLNTADLQVVPEGSAYAYYLMDYDEAGRILSEEYYDALDNPAPNRSGYAAHYAAYTESGHVKEERFIDAEGKPVAVNGYSRRELLEEDAEARTYTMRVMDETQDDASYLETRQTFDRYDRMIRVSYFNKEGNPAIGAEGASTVEKEYTGRGQIALEKYFDADSNATTVNGAYGVAKTYTPFGRIDRETWLDENGNPVPNVNGYAAMSYEYDLTNASKVEKYILRYYDADGNPCTDNIGAYGKSILYYPVTRVHEVTYLDEDGKPANTTKGYAAMQYEEDENGNRTWEGYFDKNQGQANCDEGYFSKESEYDSAGRLISERYLDRHNKLTNNAEGVAGWNGYYDAEGNLIITSKYDQDRNALPADAQ